MGVSKQKYKINKTRVAGVQCMYQVQWLLAVASQLCDGLPKEGRLPGHSQELAAGVLLPHSLLLDEGHPQHQLGQLLHAGQ